MCISCLFSIVGQFVLEDVVHSVCVALFPKVDAKGEECNNKESKDYAADDEQNHVLLDEPHHNIVVITHHGIWLVGPLAQVLILVIVSFEILIVLNLEHIDVFIAESSADSELILSFILDAMNIKVSVVFLEVQLAKVECIGVFGTGIGEHSQVTLAYFSITDPLRGYEHVSQIESSLFFTEFHGEVRYRRVNFAAWLVENCDAI